MHYGMLVHAVLREPKQDETQEGCRKVLTADEEAQLQRKKRNPMDST